MRSVVLVALVLAVSACTEGSAETTVAVSEPTTTSPATTTSSSPTTTSTTEPASPDTSDASEPDVGDPALLDEQIDSAIAFAKLFYEGADLSNIPSLDLTTSVPVDAVIDLFVFEAWVATTAPVIQWAEVLGYPGSPGFGQLRRDFNSLENNDLRAVLMGAPYEIHSVEEVSSERVATSFPESVTAAAPVDSAYLSFKSSVGPIQYVNGDGGVASDSPGWTDLERLVVLSPSDTGWKLYWYEDL